MRKLLLFLLTPALYATTITSTVCSVGNVTASGQFSCGVDNSNGFANATVIDVTQTLSLTSFSISANVRANANSVLMNPTFSNANASVNSFAVLDTQGPVRNGFIEVDLLGGGLERGIDNSSVSYNLTVGSFNFFVDDIQNFGPGPVLFPFTLGQPFLVDFDLTVQQGSIFGDPGGAIAVPNAPIRLFESDGVTPVPLFETTIPEPTTWALMAFALVLCFVQSRRVRRGRRPRI
jgi:hypothetical protein